MRVLVTDAAYLHTLAILRYLAREGIHAYVMGSNKGSDISRYSKYCRGYLEGPDYEDEKQYIEAVLEILAQQRVDLMIPVSYRATAIAAKYRNEIGQISKVEVAEYGQIGVALNKKHTYELADKLGVPVPQTCYPRRIEEVDALRSKTGYPVVIKSLFESGGQIIEYAKSDSELVEKYRHMCSKHGYAEGSLPMIQEYVTGRETYSFCALYQHGVCKRVFMFREVRSVPYRGGSGSCVESYYEPTMKEYGTKLLDALRWHGVADVEFKRDKNAEAWKLMEVNPKFWASLEVALRAGVNFPYHLCELALGKNLLYSEEYDRQLRFHFPLSRELAHVRENPKAFPLVLKDCLNPKVKSNVWWNDIRPHIREFASSVVSVLLSLTPRGTRSSLRKLSRRVRLGF